MDPLRVHAGSHSSFFPPVQYWVCCVILCPVLLELVDFLKKKKY